MDTDTKERLETQRSGDPLPSARLNRSSGVPASSTSSQTISVETVRIKDRLLAALAVFYIRLVGRTSRLIRVNAGIRERMEASGKGFIYAFWHGRQAFLVYLHANDSLRPLVSKSRDGELISRVCKAFGLITVRGSTSRGGLEALLDMREILQDGGRVSVTPDGPRGPLRKVQPGVLFLAQKTGCPIVPVAYGARQAWVFKSWDEFIVPKPFNRIAMVYGEPLEVRADDNLEQRAVDLERALNAVMREADSIAGVVCCD